ncbi:hypothetical protein KUCAC02_024556, partial [Chaenocephalus aceratus]
MAWIICGLLFSLGLFLSPVCVPAEQRGFRRLYVLQPGPGAGAGGPAGLSSISTRHGAVGHTYNVELSGPVRTRRMGNQADSGPGGQSQQQTVKLSGVNVCGGMCCHGWAKTQGSQRCTKRVAVPHPQHKCCLH